MTLTRENYHSQGANLAYFSVSQVKAFAACEAAAMADLRGETVREETSALLVGSYVDAHFSQEMDLFKAQHPQLFKRDGTLKAEFLQANEIIARIERDPFFMKYLSGEKQVIKVGKLFGLPFKTRMDSYFKGKAIVDLKIMRDFEPIYVPGAGRLNFVEAWGYDLQGAVYQAVEGNSLPFYIAAATKEKTTDIEVLQVPQHLMDAVLVVLEHRIERMDAVKCGKSEPVRCEKCDYCKGTKVLTGAIDLDEWRASE